MSNPVVSRVGGPKRNEDTAHPKQSYSGAYAADASAAIQAKRDIGAVDASAFEGVLGAAVAFVQLVESGQASGGERDAAYAALFDAVFAAATA